MIVVTKNITLAIWKRAWAVFEAAALKGAQEIGFTVLTISFSLIATLPFLPLIYGLWGCRFREFAVTLSVAILLSMIISLTATPMMCAHLLKEQQAQWVVLPHRAEHSSIWVKCNLWPDSEHSPELRQRYFDDPVCNHRVDGLHLFIIVLKGFFPGTDNGRIWLHSRRL